MIVAPSQTKYEILLENVGTAVKTYSDKDLALFLGALKVEREKTEAAKLKDAMVASKRQSKKTEIVAPRQPNYAMILDLVETAYKTYSDKDFGFFLRDLKNERIKA